MSDSGDESMGSLLYSSPVVEPPDDPDDVPQSVSIEIDGGAASTTSSLDTAGVSRADLQALEERVNLLLAVTTREQSALNARLDEMRSLDLAATLASAARDCAAAAKAAAEILEGAKEAVDLLASDEFIQEQLENHARNAAIAVKGCIFEASKDAAAAVAADVKRAVGGKKRGDASR